MDPLLKLSPVKWSLLHSHVYSWLLRFNISSLPAPLTFAALICFFCRSRVLYYSHRNIICFWWICEGTLSKISTQFGWILIEVMLFPKGFFLGGSNPFTVPGLVFWSKSFAGFSQASAFSNVSCRFPVSGCLYMGRAWNLQDFWSPMPSVEMVCGPLICRSPDPVSICVMILRERLHCQKLTWNPKIAGL